MREGTHKMKALLFIQPNIRDVSIENWYHDVGKPNRDARPRTKSDHDEL